MKGRHVFEGRPSTIVLTDDEVREALADPVRQVIQAVRDALERIPPELSSDALSAFLDLAGANDQRELADFVLGSGAASRGSLESLGPRDVLAEAATRFARDWSAAGIPSHARPGKCNRPAAVRP